MSSRLFKKVVKEQEQQQKHQEEEEQLKDNESESPDSAPRSSINLFDLLNDGDDDAAPDQESEVADEALLRDRDKMEPSAQQSTTNVVPTSNHKSKKKKKKKSKEGSASSTVKVERPLEEDLYTLSLDVNSSSHRRGPAKGTVENAKLHNNLVKQHASSVLQIDPKYLNVENELRRIFGSKVVKSFEQGQQSGSSRQVRGARRGTSYHIRKTILVSPSDHWPRWDGSFSMEFLESRDGYNYFKYVHSPSYGQAQRAFEAAQAIHDLNSVANVLMHHPYHLDSLITMADYFKFVGERQMAADAVAKCLYASECAWHLMFTPLLGNCQLKFSHETNKPLFKALFTHMINMDRRGCHRSALEVCKLLLSLDSDDPMGALFCIDYFALRAGEYAWLEQFSEDYKSDNSLWLFPNFSYSLSICRFYREREETSDVQTDNKKASSADLMKQALMLHPSVLKKLVGKVPLKDQAWTNILKHSYFSSDETKIPSLDHLINIYVERSYIIWRLPDLQKLLRDIAQQVIETLEHNKSEAKDWACVREEAFSSEKNEYGHLMIQDFSDSVSTLPPDNLQNFVVDPRMGEALHDGIQVGNPLDGGQAPPLRNVANRNPLAVLFESMLPWVNYGDGGDGIGADEDNQIDGHGQDDQEH